MTGEVDLLGAQVTGDRSCRVGPDVRGLVGGEKHGHGRIDPSLAHSTPVDKELDVSTLAQAPAVIAELDTDLMFAAGEGFLAVDLELLESEEVVAEGRLAVLGVERKATEGPSL